MRHAEVLVVGGGLLGCAAAYYLTRGGARVVLLERGELNREASGQNAGSLHFQLEFRMIVEGDAIAEQFALSLPLCLEAQARWATLEEELGESVGVHLAGGLMVAETDDEIDALRRKSALENRNGLETSILDGDEARAIAPYLGSTIRAACWCPTEGHANPRLAGPAFAAAASRLGARIRPRTEVTGLVPAGSGWRVELANGETLDAGAVVVAAGVWSGQVTALAGAPLPLLAHPLTIFATARTRPLIGHLVQHAGGRLSLKQTVEGNVLVGGGWPSRLFGPSGDDLSRRPALLVGSIAGSAAIAARVAPAVAGLSAIRVWTGVAGVTDDNVPLLGELSGLPGLFVATGGPGFTLGPTLAQLTADLVLEGVTAFPLETFSPARLAGQVRS
jgi:sarcosine oxidase, subunit beta